MISLAGCGVNDLARSRSCGLKKQKGVVKSLDRFPLLTGGLDSHAKFLNFFKVAACSRTRKL
jgi:hypothetical protein